MKKISMKKIIKQSLFRFGIFPLVDISWRTPQIIRWIGAGCTGVAPAPIKRMVISAYRKRYGLKQFIETGTHFGDTLAYIAQLKIVHATSIELDQTYYAAAKQRFAKYSNVTLLQGDSGKILPELVHKLDTPALFWLDGHYSGADTGRGELDTPVSIELQAVLESPINGHVIIIDDARCFDGTQDYPHLDRLLEMVRKNNKYNMEISTDIIRLTPKP